MKKRITTFLTLLFGVIVTQSFAQTNSFTIAKWSGAGLNNSISSIDKITFTDNDLVMKYNTGLAENIDLLSIRKITFTTNPSGNKVVIGNGKAITISLNSSNSYRINNLLEGENKVEIYSTTGILVQKTILNSYSPILEANQLNKGVYILKVTNQTIKFVRP